MDIRNEPSLRDDPDLRLVKYFQDGDQTAFDRLVKRYRNPLLNFIFRLTGHRQTSEDLVQETFLRSYQALPRFVIPASGGLRFSSWIFKVAYNLSMNELRRKKRHTEFTKAAYEKKREDSRDDPVDPMADRCGRKLIFSLMERLPEPQRAALLLRVTEGLSYKEIAAVLNRSVGSVESLIFRARTRLRKQLSAAGKE